jgi:hypothetical protein
MTERSEPDLSRSRRLFIKRSFLLVIAAVAAIGGALFAARTQTAQAQLTKSITDDRDTYYRLKVKLAYKGEPQDFDIVVGCNVHQIFYKDGGRTYEAGLIPTVFGRRMSDGKGLVVRPPSACRGETTANGKVQPDLLPVVVVYDSADTLDFGIAYLSDDAYASPLSVLKFGGATIEKATKAEFEEFRRTQENLVTRSIFWTGAAGADVLKRMNVEPAAKPFARICEGYQRYRLSDELGSLVRQYWPEGHPHYWASTYEAERALHSSVFKSRTTLQSDGEGDTPHQPWIFIDGAADFGMPTRGGGGLASTVRGSQFASAYYPAASGYRVDKWPADKKDWPRYIASVDRVADMHIDFGAGRTRGFAYCTARAFPDRSLNSALSDKRVFGRIDAEDVAAVRAPGGPSFIPLWIMDRDEYTFHYFHISLGSVRGDV